MREEGECVCVFVRVCVKRVRGFETHSEQGRAGASKENLLACNLGPRASKPEWR